MSNRCRDWIGHRVVSAIATVATLAAGCASQPAAPPEQLSPITPGDTPLSIVERGYQLVAVYQFVLDGHRYAFAGAYGNTKGYDLVFFDGHLGCTHETALTDLTDWEWVAESDGLQYLASRLRQACGLEEATTARVLSQPEESEIEPPDEVQSADRAADEALDDFFDDHPLTEAIVGGFVGSLVITAGLLWGPVLWIPGAIYESARNASAATDLTLAEHHEILDLALPISETDALSLLGKPEVRFTLPRASSSVLGYAVGTTKSLYAGVAEGQVIWIHGYYPWLEEMAKQVKPADKANR